MVFGYFLSHPTPSNKKTLDARGTTASSFLEINCLETIIKIMKLYFKIIQSKIKPKKFQTNVRKLFRVAELLIIFLIKKLVWRVGDSRMNNKYTIFSIVLFLFLKANLFYN